jgi:trehalose-phosphatase
MSILETQRGKVLELASGKSSARGGRRHKIVSIAAAPQFGSPRNLFSAWDEIADDIREARSIAVLSDFDGSLVKIQRQPGTVRLAKPVRAVLAELASHDVMVGIISGRSLTDVRKRVGLTGISYVGCQGYSIQDARGHRITLANRDERRLLATATEELKKKLAGLEGVRVEVKEATLAVHYREASRANAARAKRIVTETIAENRGLRLSGGKKVWEIFPGSGVDKWTAIRFLLSREGHMESLLIYAGDDVGDEPVFAHMSGISILVGKRRATAARYSLESPVELRRFLERVLAARKTK